MSDEAKAPKRRPLWRRIVGLALGAIVFYFALPLVTASVSQFPKLSKVGVQWLALVVGFEALSFVMVWAMLRLVLGTKRWLPVATAQLAGNALSSAVPGGAAAGAALQFRMLSEAGIEATNAASGMTVLTLLQFATLGALPLATLPAFFSGGALPSPLRRVIIIGVVVFIVSALLTLTMLAFDEPLILIGRGIRKLRLSKADDLPERMLAERNRVRRALGIHWRKAALISVGRVGFDYLALAASIGAVGAHARPSLVLIAYLSAALLALIPLTPGGLGFVEAGLAGLLTVAGVDGAHAVLATLIYRVAEYWLPLMAGPAAYALGRATRNRRPAKG